MLNLSTKFYENRAGRFYVILAESWVFSCALLSWAQPIGFQLDLGHGTGMPMAKAWFLCSFNHFWVDLNVSFWLLSCWKVQPQPVLDSWQRQPDFDLKSSGTLLESIMPCMWTIRPGLWRRNSPTALYLMLGMRVFSLYPYLFLCQTHLEGLESKSSIYVSSDHITLSKLKFHWCLANSWHKDRRGFFLVYLPNSGCGFGDMVTPRRYQTL